MASKKYGPAEKEGRDGEAGKDINKKYTQRGDKAVRRKKKRGKRGRG